MVTGIPVENKYESLFSAVLQCFPNYYTDTESTVNYAGKTQTLPVDFHHVQTSFLRQNLIQLKFDSLNVEISKAAVGSVFFLYFLYKLTSENSSVEF